MKKMLTTVLAAGLALGVAGSALAAKEAPKKTGGGDKQAKILAEIEARKKANPNLAELPLDLPKPMFKGTPVPAKVGNLRKPRGFPRPPFLAPKGTKNVALNKPITASDDLPVIGELEMITDGDLSGADGSFVELGPLKQHVQVDLEAKHKIHAVVVWHFHSQARVYHDVVVQIADDEDFIENVTTVWNNDDDNSLGVGVGKDPGYVETNEGELIDAKGAVGRYVRLYSNGNTTDEMNHYVEVQVYGQAVK